MSSLPGGKFQLGPILSHSHRSAKRAARELNAGSPSDDWSDIERCDVVIVSVPDGASHCVISHIYQCCHASRRPVVLHTGRTLAADDGKRPGLGRFFPLRVLQRQVQDLSGTTIAITGDRSVVAAARRITRGLGSRALILPADRLEQVVVGASIASDVLTGLLELAVQRVVAAGAPRGIAVEAVRELVSSSFEDFSRSGPRSRPGPLLEGQSHTVQSLLDTCRGSDPEAYELYRTALRLSLNALGKQNDAFSFLYSAPTSASPAMRTAESDRVSTSTKDRDQLRKSG